MKNYKISDQGVATLLQDQPPVSNKAKEIFDAIARTGKEVFRTKVNGIEYIKVDLTPTEMQEIIEKLEDDGKPSV